MREFDAANEMHCLIVAAHYQMRLEGHDPAGIDAAALLEALVAAVTVATEQDIVDALRAEGARLLNEADTLDRFLETRNWRISNV